MVRLIFLGKTMDVFQGKFVNQVLKKGETIDVSKGAADLLMKEYPKDFSVVKDRTKSAMGVARDKMMRGADK